MRIPSPRVFLWTAAGAIFASALFAGLRAARAADPLAAVLTAWGEVAAVAGLCWATALVAAWAATHRCRATLDRVAVRLATLRKQPSQRPIIEAGEGPILGRVAAQLEALYASYRRAVTELVTQGEALEAARAQLARGEGAADRAVVVHRGSGSSRNMVARLTPSLHWLTATPALQQFLGRSGIQLSGRPLAELIHPDDLPVLRRAFAEALETGEAHNVSLRMRCRLPVPEGPADLPGPPRPPDRERHVRMDVVTRHTDEGSPLHFRCFLADVTDRVRAEAKLRRRTEELSLTNERLLRSNQDLERLKESYRDLYHHAPAMYFSLDARGHLVGFNDTLCHALGYAREDLYQQPYTTLLTPESRERYRAEPDAYQRPGEVETRWVKKDGTVIDVWIRTVPLQDEGGRFVRSRSAAQDATERKRLADELRHRGDELERKNAELQQINKALDEFTSVVSHDLQEPLRTINAFSTFLAEDYSTQLGVDGFGCVNHLVLASRRLARLIGDLLTLCRAGRIATAPRPFNLAEAVATVRRDLADLVTRKEATIHTEGSLPVVMGDPERVTQLLQNLVSNGLNYNTSSAPRIVIGEVRGPRPANGTTAGEAVQGADPAFVTLYVRDNGIGIDRRFHEQIFGMFRRLHRRGKYEGTGAGLAICKKIVEAHAGRIWVESEPGQGATFYFTLPRAAVAAQAAAGTVPRRLTAGEQAGPVPGEGGSVGPGKGRGARLLLVEDMPEIGLIVQRLAQRARHEVKWVTSAEDAWGWLQENRPDLVLLDIHLPGMDGVELCRRLRATPAHADLPIALFSQAADPDDLEAGMAAGASLVLSKDLLCHPDAWRRHIDELLAAGVTDGTA